MKKILSLLILLAMFCQGAYAETNTPASDEGVSGKVFDKSINDVVIGAVLVVKENPVKAVATDIDGNFFITGLQYPSTLIVSYAGCVTQEVVVDGPTKDLVINLEADLISIQSVQVTRRRRQNTETAMIASLRQTNAVAVGISGAQISKTSDSDAGEVVRRIPGISMIDGKFIVVRGLAQRYNNVWINGGGVPSTEADGRAFSFDVIPSGNIDNIIISKSFTADLPGDFSGGFINIHTKGAPDESSVKLSIGTGLNSETQFHDMTLGKSASTEWLGFDNSFRPLANNFPSDLRTISDKALLNDLYLNGFNNDWSTRTFKPAPELKASVQWNSRISDKLGMVLTFNYENKFKTLNNIRNDRYDLFNTAAQKSVQETAFRDNQYSQETTLSAMNNWIYQINPANRIEFRNLFNIAGQNRYTERTGYDYTGSTDTYLEEVEYMYNSRMSYTGQLAGIHKLENDHNIDWNATYSYAYMDEPDRRVANNSANVTAGFDPTNFTPSRNEIRRYFRELSDNIISGAVNYKKEFTNGNWMPTIKAGAYGEYRSRAYNPRRFGYKANGGGDYSDFYTASIEDKMSDRWIGTGAGQYSIIEDGFYADAYGGDYYVGAAYLTSTLPVGKFIFDIGARFEYWSMNVDYNASATPGTVVMRDKSYSEPSLLPALNISYNISKRHTLRASYGRTVNRPEFREVSPSIYYDFELDAEVTGNPDLTMATIDNADLRYEFYPKSGEVVSIGAFYKHFVNPIEWTFIRMGDNSYRYSYENAASAYTAGIEVDVRKTLDFIGVPEVALVFNGALVASEVQFDQEQAVKQRSRPLQGQSPYIVNLGVYYDSNEELGLSASVLYNVIGERIMGIGKTLKNEDPDAYMPDSYEMPRNMLDFTIAKSIGERFEVKLGLKNLLNAPVTLKQFPTYTTSDGVQHTSEQITRQYYEGISGSLSFSVKF